MAIVKVEKIGTGLSDKEWKELKKRGENKTDPFCRIMIHYEALN